MDVVIIGAGLSGLTAAEILKKHGKSVLVLEARQEPGGRVRTKRFEDGTVLEAGASYIGPNQAHMQALVKRFGLTLERHGIEGHSIGVNHLDPPGVLPPLTMSFDASASTHQDLAAARLGIGRKHAP